MTRQEDDNGARSCDACGHGLARDNRERFCSPCQISGGANEKDHEHEPVRSGSAEADHDEMAWLLRKTIGDLLASLRNSVGLSQHALARRIGYSRSAIASAETGHGLPAKVFWDKCDEILTADGALERAYHRIAADRANRARERARQAEIEGQRIIAAWRGQANQSSGQGHPVQGDGPRLELAARLAAARGIDHELVTIYQEKVNLARIIDRRLGAPACVAELGEQIRRMESLARHALNPVTRKLLAGVIVDACALAGWQWLDQADFVNAWEYYTYAAAAARESESVPLQSYVGAGRAVVLLDIGESHSATEMTAQARSSAKRKVPQLLDSWLAAAHGETCAADGRRTESLRAFDDADRLISGAPTGDTPYLVFDAVHLARWRGSALARLRDREAVDILSQTLGRLDPTFTRAETALRADLVDVLKATGDERPQRSTRSWRFNSPIRSALSANGGGSVERGTSSRTNWYRHRPPSLSPPVIVHGHTRPRVRAADTSLDVRVDEHSEWPTEGR
jgi:transcriptional regulator with XRE-family HTH domain